VAWSGGSACGESLLLARLTQLSKVFGEMTKRLAASAILSPSRVIISTACWRNSAV
jgi:hypothetical protein